MCLRTKTDSHETFIIGYKNHQVFQTQKDCTFSCIGNPNAPFDTWLKATNIRIKGDWGGNYPSGFHVFKNKEDAYSYGSGIVLEVKIPLTEIVFIGKQAKSDKDVTFICKEIFVQKPKLMDLTKSGHAFVNRHMSYKWERLSENCYNFGAKVFYKNLVSVLYRKSYKEIEGEFRKARKGE